MKQARKSAWEGAGLALIPLGVALCLGPLVLPLPVEPTEIPLPELDSRALADVAQEEQTVVAKFPEKTGEMLALLSEIHALHVLQARGELESGQLVTQRDRVWHERDYVVTRNGIDAIRALFVSEREKFIAAVDEFEAHGTQNARFAELAGGFVNALRSAGWINNHDVLPSRTEQEVLYKMMWSLDLGLASERGFAPTVDEQRALYTLYLRAPHARESDRARFARVRRDTTDPVACAQIEEDENAAIESWRIDKIRALAKIDPTYPADFALGVAYYRKGDASEAQKRFTTWISAHPTGPWAIRARNHLKACAKKLEGAK